MPALGFIGRHDLRIDDKGRVTMPSRFKSVLAEKYPEDDMQVAVMVSLDLNLRVLPLSEYVKETEKYSRLTDMAVETRRLKEVITGLVAVEKVDTGGRIRLSPDLREIAKLDREVTCIGGNAHFDIWDRDKWKSNQEAVLLDLGRLTEKVQQLSLAAASSV